MLICDTNIQNYRSPFITIFRDQRVVAIKIFKTKIHGCHAMKRELKKKTECYHKDLVMLD